MTRYVIRSKPLLAKRLSEWLRGADPECVVQIREFRDRQHLQWLEIEVPENWVGKFEAKFAAMMVAPRNIWQRLRGYF